MKTDNINNSGNSDKVIILSDNELKEIAMQVHKEFALNGNQWSATAHAVLLIRALKRMNIVPTDKKINIQILLDYHGLVGNASQFRQWLFNEKKSQNNEKEIIA